MEITLPERKQRQFQLSAAGAAGEIVDVPSTVKLCPLRVHIEIGGYTTIEIDSLRESVEIVLPERKRRQFQYCRRQ
ncbi:MAG: hypothetical protein IJ943_01790 [Akkermansia sp.]|nr:hypothetical protein [Akkermansia sp.]